MILLINGAFGVGKTTVGRILRREIKGSVLYNPEWAGSILMRLPISFSGSGTDDFQDIEMWRRSVVCGIKLFRVIAKETVIVPMTFWRKDYLDQILRGIYEVDKNVNMFCLTADFQTITKRLEVRGDSVGNGDRHWSGEKARTCVEVFKQEGFGEVIDTNNLTPEIAAEIILEKLDFPRETKRF